MASYHLEPDGARWTATGRLLLDRLAAAAGRWQLFPAAHAQDSGADWVEAYESLSERVRVLEERLEVNTLQPDAKPARAQATGLVVDARGSNFIPSLSPNIRRLRGGIVYPDPAARKSLMGEGRLVALFARDVDFALGHPRVGDRPGVGGNRRRSGQD